MRQWRFTEVFFFFFPQRFNHVPEVLWLWCIRARVGTKVFLISQPLLGADFPWISLVFCVTLEKLLSPFICDMGKQNYMFSKGLSRFKKTCPDTFYSFRACVCMLSFFSCVWLCTAPWTVAHQATLSMGFSRQEYWSGLPCPPPGDLPNPRIELPSPMSPV